MRTECRRYLGTIGDLLIRGADAYLTTVIDERLSDFTNFIRNSLDREVIRKRRVLKTEFNMFGNSTMPTVRIDRDAVSLLERAEIPAFSLGAGGIRLSYSEKVLAAPVQSPEFEARIRTEVPQIKFLIKEVTLGSHSPTA